MAARYAEIFVGQCTRNLRCNLQRLGGGNCMRGGGTSQKGRINPHNIYHVSSVATVRLILGDAVARCITSMARGGTSGQPATQAFPRLRLQWGIASHLAVPAKSRLLRSSTSLSSSASRLRDANISPRIPRLAPILPLCRIFIFACDFAACSSLLFRSPKSR